jgi:hypothetical protein
MTNPPVPPRTVLAVSDTTRELSQVQTSREDMMRTVAFAKARVRSVREAERRGVGLRESARFFVHVLPLGREDEVRDDLRPHRWDWLHADWRGVAPAAEQPRSERFNRDGYVLEYPSSEATQWHVQFLRNGGVEFASGELHTWNEQGISGFRGYAAFDVFRYIIPKLVQCVYTDRSVAAPLAITVTALDLAGVPMTGLPDAWVAMVQAGELQRGFEHSVLEVPPLVLTSATAYARDIVPQLQPLADRLWQCAGFPHAPDLPR